MSDIKQKAALLVEKFQSGDSAAFGELYQLVSGKALFVALEITKNKQDAEDVLQDSFITAYEKIGTLEKPESFVGWFNQIVANRARDYLKKKKPLLFDEEETQVFELIPDEDREFNPQENFNDNETRQMVLDAVNELSDEKRICVLLHYYNEMSIADIAQTVGSNENTVKSRLFQARKDLSVKFKNLEKKGLYGFSPVGILLWAWKSSEDTVAKTFIASKESAAILSTVTANAGAGAATTAAGTASVSAAGTVSATSAAAGATGVSGSVAAGTGMAAKIAAMSVAQKVIAGISVSAVVAGSTAGVATVVVNNVSDDPTTAPYTEEYTTAPDIEQTVAMGVMATVEFSETTSATGESETQVTVTVNSTTKPTSTTKSASTTKPASTTKQNSTSATTKSTTAKPTTTKPTTTKPTTTKPTTTKPTTTKKQTTTKPTTTKPTTTTTKPTTTTTKPTTTTTKPTTTKPTTTKPTTTATKPTTTIATTLADPIVRISYMPPDSAEYSDYPEFSVPAGTNLNTAYLYNFMMNESGIEMVDCMINNGDFTDSAESGKIYNFEIICG